jgi:hypothetical protein
MSNGRRRLNFFLFQRLETPRSAPDGRVRSGVTDGRFLPPATVAATTAQCRRTIVYAGYWPRQTINLPVVFELGRAARVFGFILVYSTLSAAPLERSVSPSRQFIIFGGNRILRSAVSDAAERVKAKLLGLLQLRDQWSVPILLHLQRPQANAPEVPPVLLNFSQTGAGLKIQLDLLVDRDFQPAVLQREVLRALLLELSYRTLPSLPAGTPYIAPPDWLVDGILTLDSESPEVFEGLDSIASNPPALKNFLAQHPRLLDSQSRALYRACASALVRILLEHENGRAQLNRYIADLPRASVDALSDLQVHFPWLGKDSDAMEKNWRENVVRVANERRFALITFAATSEQLDECLRTKIAQDREKKNSLNLGETVRASRPNIDTKAANELGQRLTLLATRAHPLLRPVVVDYQLAAELLARKKRHGLARRLAGSAALREKIAARMSEVDDFMNWYEATQAKTASGAFRDYLHAADSSEQIPRRHDALSVYLDALETQLQ